MQGTSRKNKKRKTNNDDDAEVTIASLEVRLAQMKRDVEELENEIQTRKAGLHQIGMLSQMDDPLRSVMGFLDSRDIVACFCVCKHWKSVLDNQKGWEEAAKIRYDHFVSCMEATAKRNGTEVDYKKITKRLISNKPERSWIGGFDAKADDDLLSPLAARDLVLLVQIKDQNTCKDIEFSCASLENLISGEKAYGIRFDQNQGSSKLLPIRLAGEFKDHFNRWDEPGLKVPNDVVDSVCVTLRLWRQDKQQCLCLCQNIPAKAEKGFTLLHNAMTSFPSQRANPDAVVARMNHWHFSLFCSFRCQILRRLPAGTTNRLNVWKETQYAIRPLEFAIGGSNNFDSVEDLLKLLNVLDWE